MGKDKEAVQMRFIGCDQKCEECFYPDCQMPDAKAARGIRLDDWVYMRDGILEKGKRGGVKRHHAPPPPKVICIDTGIKYDTVRAAAKDNGISESAISNCLHGRTKTAGRKRWKYEVSQQADDF